MNKKYFLWLALAFGAATMVIYSKDDKGKPETPVFKNRTVAGIELIAVRGGTFLMGAQSSDPEAANYDADAEDSESPVHSVTLSDFYIGKYEVTQGQWKAVMGNNPSRFTGDDNKPVEGVSWNDIQEFLVKLNEQTGKTFRLPTEAEWEYAARGGRDGARLVSTKYSGSNTVGDVAWYYDNSYALGSENPDYGTHKVGTKAPNALGIYDMSGNVWERCNDWYSAYSTEAQANPTGPESGSDRVIRGGSWSDYAGSARVSLRGSIDPSYRNDYLGFRLALSSK